MQIEINRALYMDETRISRNAGFAALSRDLAVLIRAFAGSDTGRTAGP